MLLLHRLYVARRDPAPREMIEVPIILAQFDRHVYQALEHRHHHHQLTLLLCGREERSSTPRAKLGARGVEGGEEHRPRARIRGAEGRPRRLHAGLSATGSPVYRVYTRGTWAVFTYKKKPDSPFNGLQKFKWGSSAVARAKAQAKIDEKSVKGNYVVVGSDSWV